MFSPTQSPAGPGAGGRPDLSPAGARNWVDDPGFFNQTRPCGPRANVSSTHPCPPIHLVDADRTEYSATWNNSSIGYRAGPGPRISSDSPFSRSRPQREGYHQQHATSAGLRFRGAPKWRLGGLAARKSDPDPSLRPRSRTQQPPRHRARMRTRHLHHDRPDRRAPFPPVGQGARPDPPAGSRPPDPTDFLRR